VSSAAASEQKTVFVVATQPPSELLQSNVEEGDAILWHLYHSGFAIKTAQHLLIFDYWPGTGEFDEERGLAAGLISPAELQGQNVVVFFSHEHYDHWYRDAIEWKDQVDKIHYVVSPEVSHDDNRYAGSDGIVTTLPADRSTTVRGMEITTIQSTDSGVAFLVKIDGLSIYHSGDHAAWNWDHASDAETEFAIERLRALDGEVIDIAMHVCDPRLKKSGWGGTFAFADRYQPRLLVPMHMKGKYEQVVDAQHILEESGVSVAFWPVQSRGECIVFQGMRQ